jgi:phage tail protein X
MASSRVILHVTRAGERWDLLAWQFYGDPAGYSTIIFANPSVPIVPVFDAGITIAVPVLPASPAAAADLPPWKRTSAGAA